MLRFYAGGRADEMPRSVVIAGEEEDVEVISSVIEETGGVRRRRFGLRTSDGGRIDVAEDPSREGRWRILGESRGEGAEVTGKPAGLRSDSLPVD
jgi:hypothetical protein